MAEFSHVKGFGIKREEHNRGLAIVIAEPGSRGSFEQAGWGNGAGC
jgi:hypothetical protein